MLKNILNIAKNKKMKNITIKEIIEFRRKSIKSRESFIKKIQKVKAPSESGGDYWISASSAISRAFKSDNNQEISDKINDLLSELEKPHYKRTKIMYQRNLDILHNFEDFDLKILKPNSEIEFLKKPKILEIIEILNLPVKITPSHIFTYEKNDCKYIGGLWIACKLEGFSLNELASFTEGLYKYIEKNYSKEYLIDKDFCIALDAYTGNIINYSTIEKGEHSSVFELTIPIIKDAM